MDYGQEVIQYLSMQFVDEDYARQPLRKDVFLSINPFSGGQLVDQLAHPVTNILNE